jgi:hypothetical protein
MYGYIVVFVTWALQAFIETFCQSVYLLLEPLILLIYLWKPTSASIIIQFIGYYGGCYMFSVVVRDHAPRY